MGERKNAMSESYLLMAYAIVYHNIGNNAQAIRHIDRALALPDKRYGVHAEYCRGLDALMEKRLSAVDEDA